MKGVIYCVVHHSTTFDLSQKAEKGRWYIVAVITLAFGMWRRKGTLTWTINGQITLAAWHFRSSFGKNVDYDEC